MDKAPTGPMPGEFAPWFRAPALSGSPRYTFDTVAGRMILMLFFGSARSDRAARALRLVGRHRELFDDTNVAFFGVTTDPSDAAKGRIAQSLPGIRFFLDFEGEIGRLFGVAANKPEWIVLDRQLRVVRRFAIGAGKQAIDLVRERSAAAEDRPAPVITVPEVLEPELCRKLIDLYRLDGGTPSGFMRDVGGKTTLIQDPAFKSRRDCSVEDEALQKVLTERIRRRLVPSIARAFQFHATRIERWLVASYEAGAGHFRPHRDNTTFGTAHRRFAVTINLNAGEYEGGDLRFPEFGRQTYRAPTGGAVVFSCSLLHEATPVTSGQRFAFLPFLYDEAAAEIRRKNLHLLAEQPAGQNAGS